MLLIRKIAKVFFFPATHVIGAISPATATRFQYHVYRSWGMQFGGPPNYIAASAHFDGSDYSKIELGEGVTVSSNVRFLTHDWSLYTIGRAAGVRFEKPVGRHLPIRIGAFSFIGLNSVLLPGVQLGRGCLVGSGTVVRGSFPDFSLVIGNPGIRIGSSLEYLTERLPQLKQIIAPQDTTSDTVTSSGAPAK